MLPYDLWQRRFGGDPGVIGRTQVLNGAAFTVVGILPRDFVIPNAEMDVAAPLQLMSDQRRSNRGTNFLRLMAGLKPGVTPIQAERELGAITDRLRQQFPEDNGNLTSPKVVPLQDEVVGNYRQSLLVLLGAAESASHRLLKSSQSSDRAARRGRRKWRFAPRWARAAGIFATTRLERPPRRWHAGLILATRVRICSSRLAPVTFRRTNHYDDGRVPAFARRFTPRWIGPQPRPGAPCRPKRSQPRTQDGRSDRRQHSQSGTQSSHHRRDRALAHPARLRRIADPELRAFTERESRIWSRANARGPALPASVEVRDRSFGQNCLRSTRAASPCFARRRVVRRGQHPADELAQRPDGISHLGPAAGEPERCPRCAASLGEPRLLQCHEYFDPARPGIYRCRQRAR